MENSLQVTDLLKAVYEDLKNKFPHKELTFEKIVRTEIADDTDWHRSRTGYMCYKKALYIKYNGKAFIFSYGTKCGQYSGDEYSCDLMLLEVPLEEEHQLTEIPKLMRLNDYFKSSLIIGMSDGSLGTNSKGKMAGFSMPFSFRDFVAQDVETKSGVVFMDLRSVPSQVAKYKSGLVNVLVNSTKEFILALSL